MGTSFVLDIFKNEIVKTDHVNVRYMVEDVDAAIDYHMLVDLKKWIYRNPDHINKFGIHKLILIFNI